MARHVKANMPGDGHIKRNELLNVETQSPVLSVGVNVEVMARLLVP